MIIIDRIENDIVICEKEDGSICEIPRSLMPDDIKEGCVVKQSGNMYVIDKQAEDARRKRIREMEDSLFE